MLFMLTSNIYANQICTLVSQSHEDNGKIICDYVCEDGSSRTRYTSQPYCPAEIGQPVAF